MMYRCPSCGDGSPFAAACDRCGRAMTIEGEAAAGDVPARNFSRRLAFGAILGAAHGAVVGVFFLMPLLGRTGFFALWGGAGFSMVLLLVPVVAAIMLGAWMGRHAANLGARVLLERDRRRDVARFETTPRRSLGALDEGPVRVRGFVRALVPACTANGDFCAACEALPDGATATTPRQASGGVFELVDGEGHAAWVDARHVAVVDGPEVEGERVVPPGVVVELWAMAARNADVLESARGYREVASAWVLQGTPSMPVVVRVV